MNVVFVAHAIPDRGQPMAGFPTYLYRVSRALIDMGHKPVILAGGKRNDSWIDNGIEVIRVRDDCLDDVSGERIKYITASFKKSYRLNQEIKKLETRMKIDIIQFTSLYGTALLYHGKIPAVMRLSSYAKTYYASYETHSKEYVETMAWIERCAARRCNAVFAPCKNTANAFGKDIKRKVYTIETPFVEDVYVYDETYTNTVLQHKKYALFFGTLYADKGVKVIARCLKHFLETNKDYYFVFVGKATEIDGENAVRMMKRSAGSYADRIIILPSLLHAQLYPIIQKADFVVLPSLMDNFPNACIEAMHFGKVVIGTDGASFEQLIQHGVSGLLCRIGDADDLLEKMQTAVMLDAEQKEQIGCNAKKRIDRLSPDIVVKRLVSFYDYVIKSAGCR